MTSRETATQSSTPPASVRTILLTGGGTAGHITPLLAIARELKKLQPNVRIVYVGERNGKFRQLTDDNPDIDESYAIFAGKFRRYHGYTWLQRLFDVKTNLLNIRDAFFVLIGFVQGIGLIGKVKPDVILLKGGFVGVPIGLAGALRRRVLVTHDSDSVPGLANRLVSRWAKFHATAMPANFYKYPEGSVRHVGVLVSEEFKPVTPMLQKQYKIDLGLSPSSRMVVVTGGSQGSRVLNLALVKSAPKLLDEFTDLHIIHQVGRGNTLAYGDYTHPRLQVLEFMQRLYKYLGAADVVVTRGGATTLAELGVEGKACVVVPSPYLTGGHQIKNVKYLLQQNAVLSVDELEMAKDPSILSAAVSDLLTDAGKRKELGANLQAVTIPDATQRLAVLVLDLTALEG